MAKDRSPYPAVRTAHLVGPKQRCLIVPMRAFETRESFRATFVQPCHADPEGFVRNEGWCRRARALFATEFAQLAEGDRRALGPLLDELPAAEHFPEVRAALSEAIAERDHGAFKAIVAALAVPRPTEPDEHDAAYRFLRWTAEELRRAPDLEGITKRGWLQRYTGATETSDPDPGSAEDRAFQTIDRSLSRRAKRENGYRIEAFCARHLPGLAPYQLVEMDDELPVYQAMLSVSLQGFERSVELERLLRRGGLPREELGRLFEGIEAHAAVIEAEDRRTARRRARTPSDSIEQLAKLGAEAGDVVEAVAGVARELWGEVVGKGKSRR